MIPLCKICFDVLKLPNDEAIIIESTQLCAFCFGILKDNEFCMQIANKVAEERKLNGYDGNSFVLALNFPLPMHLREVVMEKLLDDIWVPLSMSPKQLFSGALMSKISELCGLRPTLNSDLILTITITQDEFLTSDLDYLLLHFPNQLTNGPKKRRRRSSLEELPGLYTKVKINAIANDLTKNTAKEYPMISPKTKCTFSVAFEREAQFVAGRYCKFSRNLPQSPWAVDFAEPKNAENSISEKIGSILQKHFMADGFRFIAAGREDIDVRMLGTGRPFAVQLLNARRVADLSPQNVSLRNDETEPKKNVLENLARQINFLSKDISVNSLVRVNAKEAQELNVGQEEKRKTYSALCYSKIPLTEEHFKLLKTAAPVEISQKTAIRVLKRRPLIARKRMIFAMNSYKLDEYHFVVKLETQAGTYVKEFIHGDFGRTRPALATLMGLELDQLDILELDVENVDLEWPPKNENLKHSDRFKYY